MTTTWVLILMMHAFDQSSSGKAMVAVPLQVVLSLEGVECRTG
jgi:hypothetical protein